MNLRPAFLKMALTAFLTGSFSVSMAEDASSNVIQPQKAPSGIEYVTGGVGEGREKAMKSMRKDYNLHLTFARPKSGAYLADVKVTVENPRNEKVLDVVSTGPLLFANLPDGKYQVTAEAEGKRQIKKVTIRNNQPRGVVYYFARQGD